MAVPWRCSLTDGISMKPVTELPRVGTTEAWYFQNLTEDAHPIHIHLVEFQLEDRQIIDRDRFKAYWERQNLNADGITGRTSAGSSTDQNQCGDGDGHRGREAA